MGYLAVHFHEGVSLVLSSLIRRLPARSVSSCSLVGAAHRSMAWMVLHTFFTSVLRDGLDVKERHSSCFASMMMFRVVCSASLHFGPRIGSLAAWLRRTSLHCTASSTFSVHQGFGSCLAPRGMAFSAALRMAVVSCSLASLVVSALHSGIVRRRSSTFSSNSVQSAFF